MTLDPLKAPLVWVDLEMTGLDIHADHIIEVAILLTDTSKDLKTLPHSLHLVINQPREVMDAMNDWCTQHHGASGLTQAVLDSTVTLAQAEEQVLAFLKRHVPERQGILCGNSVHVDRMFLAMQMPRVVAYLHYRIIDVSTIKSLGERWYPKQVDKAPRKGLSHRAMDDIEESIQELRYYQSAIFKRMN